MKKFLTTLFAVLLVLGVIMTAASASDAMIAINGKTVALNESTKSDFDDKAMIEGEVYYVYDCIATETVTTTTYGVKTKKETNFYLIESYDKDYFENGSDYEPLTLIYATADEKNIKKLDSMVDAWYDFEDLYNDWYYDDEAGDEDIPDYPSETFDLFGIITDYDDDELYGYRDDYIEDMGYTDDELNDFLDTYCVDMIIKDTDPNEAKTIFFAGIPVALIGLVGLILTLIKSKKSKNNANTEETEINS